MASSFEFDSSGLDKLGEAVRNIRKQVLDQSAPARESAIFLLGQVQRAFVNEGLFGKWKPLAPLTKFIRAHRRSAPNRTALPLRDRGRLLGSLVKYIEGTGEFFGVSTNVAYAALMNDGGPAEGNTEQIASFQRRRPSIITREEGARLSAIRRKSGLTIRQLGASGAYAKVRPYQINVKPGHQVPARQFMPKNQEELVRLGWMDSIVQIFKRHLPGQAA